jgi:hypothetical protein
MAKATVHICIQGDSYGYDFTSTSLGTFDDNWYGNWAIVQALGDAPVSSGVMNRSLDQTAMELRIKPSDTDPIPVGTYILVVELSNDAIEFNKEVMQDQFKITAQGV